MGIRAAAIVTIGWASAVFISAETVLAFTLIRARDSYSIAAITNPPSRFSTSPRIPRLSPHLQNHRPNQRTNNHSFTQIHLYRKFHDFGWNKFMSENDSEIDTVPEELKSNTSPAKGAPEGTKVVVELRSISNFPRLATAENDKAENCQVLRLARSAFLETQSSSNEALITPMTIHVLNFVLFPSPYIHGGNGRDGEDAGYLGLPIFGADIVTLPGNKHLVALDFQPVLPLDSNDKGKEKSSLFPGQYLHMEKKLEKIHSKYQKSHSDSTPLLPWGGDIPPQAQRFFSPYALWTRLGDENAIDTVNNLVWKAFQEYTDLYVELMNAVQKDLNAGKLGIGTKNDSDNPVVNGQIEYLEYRRANDPARPMLQRLYGIEWSEKVIGDVLFPNL